MLGAIHRSIFLALLISTAASRPAAAQDEPGRSNRRDRDRRGDGKEQVLNDIQRARYRSGPFYLLSNVRLADIGYDQDIYLPSKDEASSKSNDLTVTVAAPQKLYFLPSRKFALSAEVEPAYVWFRKNDEERTWNHQYRGDAHVMLNHLYVDVFGVARKLRKRDLSEFNQRITQEQRHLGVHSELDLSSRTKIELTSTYQDLEFPSERGTFDEERAQVLRRDEMITTASFLHKTFGATSIGGAVDFADYDFHREDSRDSSEQRVFLQLAREKEIHQLHFRVGHTKLDYRQVDQKDFSGVIGSATWIWSPRRTVNIESTAARGIQFSTFGANNHLAVNRQRVSAVWEAPFRVQIRAVGEHGSNDYFVPVFDTDTRTSKKRQDTILYASIGFLAPVTRLARAGFDVGFYERESNFSTYSDRGIRLVFRLSISP